MLPGISRKDYKFRVTITLLRFLFYCNFNSIIVKSTHGKEYDEDHSMLSAHFLDLTFIKDVEMEKVDRIMDPKDNYLIYYSAEISTRGLDVPSTWCISNDSKSDIFYKEKLISMQKAGNKSMNYLRDHCFQKEYHKPGVYNSIKKGLRMLKEAFEKNNVNLIMSYKTSLISLRYSRNVFVDSDYEFVIFPEDYKKSVKILEELSVNMLNNMTFTLTNDLELGIACVNLMHSKDLSTSQTPRTFGPFNPKKIFSNCEAHVFFINFTKDMNKLETQNMSEVSSMLQYRPLDNTLFQYWDGFKELPYTHSYCLSTKKSTIKDTSLLTLLEESLPIKHSPIMCRDIAIPCQIVDHIEPRNYKFQMDGYIQEIQLNWYKKKVCNMRALFLTAVNRTK